jgi:ubiquinone/menaquinone biosynthesis C-methylase UbiE
MAGALEHYLDGAIQQHNERPAAVWSSGGRDYDEISRGIADAIEHCVLRLHPKPGERILDLSTGTGWTARVVAKRGATVVGVDIATGLLQAARDKSNADGLTIDYRVGDAESLPFRDGEFDAVVSTFGIMFASRPEAAAAELARVCRSGGRVALTTWTSDSNLFRLYEVMRRYMSTSSDSAPRSPFEWGRTDRVKELLGANFKLRFERSVSYYREPSGEAAWVTFSKGYGPTRSLAIALDPDRREALRRDFTLFHASFPTELGICVPRDYWLTVGTRT